MHLNDHSSTIYNGQDMEAIHPLTDEWIKKMWYIYTVEYYPAIKKEWNFAISSNMDGLGGYYAKWNKSDRERQILYDITYMWNLKIKQMNISMTRKQTHRHRK